MERNSKTGEDGNELELTEKKNLLNEKSDNNKTGDMAAVQFIDSNPPNDFSPQYSEQPAVTPQGGKVTFWLVLTALVAVLGGSFPNGYNTAVLNPPEKVLKHFLNVSWYGSISKNDSALLSDGSMTVFWSLTTSGFVFGGMAGSFTFNLWAEWIGRRGGLIAVQAFAFVAAALFVASRYVLVIAFPLLFAARFFVGYAAGAGSGMCPMFLTEIAPVNIRGAMGVLHQCGLVVGILFAQIMGLKQLLGNESLWPLLLALTCVPNLISCAILPFCPESPRYIFTKKHNEPLARKEFARLGAADVDVAIADLKESSSQQATTENAAASHGAPGTAHTNENWTIFRVVTTLSLLLPLSLVVVPNFAQQVTGINAVFFYSNSIFKSCGIPEDYIQWAVLGTGLINVIGTFLAIYLVEKFGRKTLLLLSCGGAFVFMGILTFGITLSLWLPTVTAISFISITALLCYIICFAVGLGCIPQFLGGELFQQAPRSSAMAIAAFSNWMGNTAVGLLFPILQHAMKQWVFVIFMVFAALAFAYLYVFLPETKGRSVDEILELLSRKRGGSRPPNNNKPQESVPLTAQQV